jgi:hypothetical protein
MHILIDDEPYLTEVPRGQTVQQLAQSACRGDDPDQADRIVVSLRCDGEPVPDHQLDEVLQTTVSAFEKLELQTRPLRALLHATLGQASELLEQTAGWAEEAANLLSDGKTSCAMEKLQQVLSSWQEVQDATQLAARALGTQVEELTVSGQRVQETLEPLKLKLRDLRTALQNGDLVLVGDLLRYELEEWFDCWRGVLMQLSLQTA